MEWILGGVLAVAAIAYLFFGKAKPMVHRGVPLNGLRRYVHGFLLQMTPGSVFMADREGGPGFLQLALRTRGKSWRTAQFGLPEVPWSRHAFDPLIDELRQAGHNPEIEAGEGDVERFLTVSVSGDLDQVASSLAGVLTLANTALGWSPEQRFSVRMLGGLDPSILKDAWAVIRKRGT